MPTLRFTWRRASTSTGVMMSSERAFSVPTETPMLSVSARVSVSHALTVMAVGPHNRAGGLDQCEAEARAGDVDGEVAVGHVSESFSASLSII